MLGMAASSVPLLLLPENRWEAAYDEAQFSSEDRQPFLREEESPEQIQEYVARAKSAYSALRDELEAYAPDALIVVGCRRNEPASQTATFSLLTQPDAGLLAKPGQKQVAEYSPRRLDFATSLAEGLVKRGFDLAWQPIEADGLPESISVALAGLAPSTHPTVVPILINTSTPPLPTAERCWQLGDALSEVVQADGKKTAILAVGGLSYDPLARWVDEPFDRWFLKALETGDSAAIKRLFRVDTEVLLGRTGEVRTWITAAAAVSGAITRIVDYFPARQAKSGIGFVLWPEPTE